jgi:hypothetical protein
MATPTIDAHTTPRRGRWALAIAVVVLGAAATTWRLWEQDVFWQVRAGRELLATWRWPMVDTWSYTAAGGPWHNFQWLSTLLLATAERVGGIAGLVLLRDLTVALLLALALVGLRSVRQRSAWLATALLGLLWLSCARRFQVRSDFLVTLLFAALLVADLGRWSWRARRLTFIGLVVLAANLHPGTAPFVQLAALACMARDSDGRSWRREAIPMAAVLAGLLVTPYHVHILPYLWQHLFYSAYQAVPNPDHQALTLARSWAGRSALGPGAWLVLVLVAGVLAVRRLRGLDRAAVLREGGTLALLALLAGLTVNRDRVMPYSAIFALASIGRYWPEGDVHGKPMVRAALAALVWLVAIPLWLSRPAVQFGLGLDARLHPVGAARFIAHHGLRPQVLHFQGEGNYLLYALPEYPVFLDTRESMYESLGPTYRDMVNSPDLMNAVMNRYGVNTVLLPESFLLAPWRAGTSRRAAFFPKREFALVYFDERYLLLARRIPEHAALIAEHEYQYLLPYRDPTAYLATRDRTPERDLVFRREVERCRREAPSLPHCQVAASALSEPAR